MQGGWLANLAPSSHIAACSLLLLSGCVQGPAYVKPQVEVPSTYRFDQDAGLGAQADLSHGWWGQFGDEHLDGLVEEALVNNRDMRIAASRVDEFAAILAGTRAQGLPQLGYGLSAGASRRSQAVRQGAAHPAQQEEKRHGRSRNQIRSTRWGRR